MVRSVAVLFCYTDWLDNFVSLIVVSFIFWLPCYVDYFVYLMFILFVLVVTLFNV